MRICDGLLTLDDIIAITAMIQAMVVWLGDQYEEGIYSPLQQYWIVRENKWRAARWAPDADVIVDEEGRLEPLAESIGRLIESLEPVSKRPGSHAELMRVPEVMRTGPSYARQRQVYADTGDFTRVVQSFVTELRDSVPGVERPDPLRLSGVATNLPSAKPGAVPTRRIPRSGVAGFVVCQPRDAEGHDQATRAVPWAPSSRCANDRAGVRPRARDRNSRIVVLRSTPVRSVQLRRCFRTPATTRV